MIRLTKNGLIDNKDMEISDRHDIFMSLNESVEFEDGVTLRDLFRIFGPIKDFISAYSTIDYDAYAEELVKPVDWSKKEACPIDHIEITHSGSVFEKFKNVTIGTDAHGVDSSVPIELHGTWTEGDEHSKSRYWAIDAQSMNNMADLPIKLNKSFEIEKEDDFTKIVTGMEMDFTLLEAINAVFYEISFFGQPQDRDDFLDMMGDRLDAIKNMTEEEKQAKLIPWEEVKKRLEKDGDV